jgi:hypothetical protein
MTENLRRAWTEIVTASWAYAPNAQSGPGERGPAVAPCPSDSRARARGLRRRCSCSSPPVAAARQPGTVRWLRALARLRTWRWHGTTAPCHAQAWLPTKAAPPAKRPFRIEPRAPASPTQRRGGVRSERAVGATRASVPAGTPRPPDSRAGHGGFADAARGLRRPRSCLGGPAACGGGTRCRGFENAAPHQLLPVWCCDDVPWGVVTRCGAAAVVRFGPFEPRREYAR